MTYKLVVDKKGRKMWYKDGKRVAEASVPETIKKSSQGSKKHLEKSSIQKTKLSMSQSVLKHLGENYMFMDKDEILSAMRTSLTLEQLRRLLVHIPRPRIELKVEKRIKADEETRNPLTVCGPRPGLRCDMYCSKSKKEWLCK